MAPTGKGAGTGRGGAEAGVATRRRRARAWFSKLQTYACGGWGYLTDGGLSLISAGFPVPLSTSLSAMGLFAAVRDAMLLVARAHGSALVTTR